MNKKLSKIVKIYFKNKMLFSIFCGLFILLVITRFVEPETKSGFGYDQVDNAWAVKNIVIDGKLPIVGMQAKGNTGFYIGPYYYYLLVPFYLITGMDPIASPIVAGLTAIFTFFVVFFVVRSIFNEKVALAAVFINTVSAYIFELDRVQWPVNFIVPISLLFFLSIYKICMGKMRYFFLLAAAFGFSLHIHFTSIFYIVLFLLALPFIPRKKETLKYGLYSLPVLLVFIAPIAISYLQTKTGGNATSYLGSTFHGFHLRRFIQIIGDGFIEFNSILRFPYALYFSVGSFIAFLYLIFSKRKKEYLLIGYLSIIWVLVPWLAFSTYSGEITNYYFAISRPVAVMVFAYLIVQIFSINKLLVKAVIVIFLGYYAFVNLYHFTEMGPMGLSAHRKAVSQKIEAHQKVEFVQGDPQSYIYYLYQLKNKNSKK